MTLMPYRLFREGDLVTCREPGGGAWFTIELERPATADDIAPSPLATPPGAGVEWVGAVRHVGTMWPPADRMLGQRVRVTQASLTPCRSENSLPVRIAWLTVAAMAAATWMAILLLVTGRVASAVALILVTGALAAVACRFSSRGARSRRARGDGS